MNEFERTLSMGKIGEGDISMWMRSMGWNILPAYEIEMSTGKGPRLYTASRGELVTPDMLAFNGEEIRWIEAKTKSSFTWYRIGERWQDGIDKRHWEDYKQVADITGWHLWILFLHRTNEAPAKDTPEGLIPPTGLFGSEIGFLRVNIDHESDRYANGMVYWNIETLQFIHAWPLMEDTDE